MRETVCSFIGTIFVFFCACESAAAVICSEMNENQYNNLNKLYEYAQIVENPEYNESDDRVVCAVNDSASDSEESSKLIKLEVPMEFINQVRLRMRAWNDMPNERIIFRRIEKEGDDKSPQFAIGCYGQNEYENDYTEIALDIAGKIFGQDVVFYVIGKELRSTIIDLETGDTMVVTPGTNLFNHRQFRANFVGEDCVFPLINFTVEVLCETLSQQNDELYDAFTEINKNEIFLNSSRSLSMIGHSLGGTATQYVALNLPDACIPEGGFGGFKGFAFSSPGLKKSKKEYGSVQSGSAQSPINTLQSFVIDGDQVLDLLFWRRRQLGQAAVFSPPDSQNLCHAHSIAHVQKGICLCLQGEGIITQHSSGSKNSKILSEGLCPGEDSS